MKLLQTAHCLYSLFLFLNSAESRSKQMKDVMYGFSGTVIHIFVLPCSLSLALPPQFPVLFSWG